MQVYVVNNYSDKVDGGLLELVSMCSVGERKCNLTDTPATNVSSMNIRNMPLKLRFNSMTSESHPKYNLMRPQD
jgi:hypothetical protein